MSPTQLWKYHSIVFLLFFSILFVFSSPGACQDNAKQEIARIGVLAKRGPAIFKKRWSATASYLNSRIADHHFTVTPLTFQEITQAVEDQELDFILVNSAIFAGLEAIHGVSCVATMKTMLDEHESTVFGGVIFTRADRPDLQSLSSLKGKNFMAVDRQSLGGWLMALRELKSYGIHPDNDFNKLNFTGTHDAVVYGVLAGEADAGTVRSDTLERMALERKISLNEIRVFPFSRRLHDSALYINPDIYENFPYQLSTQLYPEWPFAKLNNTSEQLAKKVALALYQMPSESAAAHDAHIAGWTIPHQYQSVRECLQDLHVWPYDTADDIQLSDVLKQYWLYILAGLITLSLSLLAFFYVSRLNKALQISRQELENAFRDQKASLDYMFEESLNEIYIFDAMTLKFLRVNKGAQRNLGYNADELSQMTPVDINPDFNEDAFHWAMGPLITSQGKCLIFETRHQRKDGSTYPVEVHIQSSHYLNREVYTAIVLDITARKEAELEKKKLEVKLQQSQKMESIGTLAGGIAHDFNNILEAILGYTQMSQLKIDNKEQLTNFLEQINLAANRAVELVEQILTFSRKTEERKTSPLHPHFIVKEAVKMLRSSLPSTATLHEKIECQTCQIMADPTNIHQIVVNLCTNALHALPNEKGEISVGLSCCELDADEITDASVSPGAFVQLTVADNGHGIDPSIKDRILDPYFTTKEKGKGTGLGLAVIYGIVKDYNGIIQVDSQPGEGTTFRILLPMVHEATRASDHEDEPDSTIPTGTESILVVDDEPAIVELCTAMLTDLGYHVTGITDSHEALALFEAEPNRFDLILSDQTMPGLTGAELAQHVFKIRPDMPFIICTGYSSIINVENARDIGIKKFLKKPVTHSQRAQAIREVLDHV
ncbi:MAG: hypothetical protein C0613_05415 [Desulfobulbaceae bacterium]|nr:MAG: hypothetical protein C0613_05415 [Desulfobulbaceae bacterium]